ncbi:hypothetical protein SCACP_27430 [Sporomusa carbonis]
MDNDSCLQYCWCLSKCTKKCIKIYEANFKLYRVCHYRLYKVCPRCGCEFDYYCYCVCPCCGDNPDEPPEAGFVFFPELELETSPFTLFPELAFKP